MEHITIVLVSSDQEYGKALGLGLLHVCRSFMIRILNPQEILQDNEKNSSDLIIWDGELPEEADAMQGCMIHTMVVKTIHDPHGFSEKRILSLSLQLRPVFCFGYFRDL